MILVVGEPRSGTSLQMRILKELGFSIAGKRDMDQATKDFNPTGTWEVPGITHNGVHGPIEEDAIKVSVLGLLNMKDSSFVDKVILCIRDPREVIVSMRNQINWISDDHNWNLHLGHICALTQRGIPTMFHIVDYGDVMWQPKIEVERLAKYLGVEVTQEAIDIIRPELYRSNKHQCKRNKYCKSAEKYYQAIRRCIK